MIKNIKIKPAKPVAILSITTSVNVFVFFFVSIGIGIDSNSVAALFTDCFKLPSITFITIITHNSGINNNTADPIKIPVGSHNNDFPTPKVPTIRWVKNS